MSGSKDGPSAMRDHHVYAAQRATPPAVNEFGETCAADARAAELAEWDEFLAACVPFTNPSEEDLLSKLRSLLGC